ncbi:unnamed protein product [Lathyrus sativus]|nr:unnamed protein product [Lathyrus sativus]
MSSFFTLPSTFSKFQFYPFSSSSCSRLVCRGASNVQHVAKYDLDFVLHDALDASGIDTTHARVKTRVLILQTFTFFLCMFD